MKKLLFPIFLLWLVPADALKCYTCSHTSATATDVECTTNPENVAVNAVTDCDRKYCISIRTEFVETKDQVLSIVRTCADSFIFKDKVIEDPFYRTHYKACDVDLCNGGTGRVADSKRDPDDGDEVLILVPGTGKGNFWKISCYLFFLILVLNFVKLLSML